MYRLSVVMITKNEAANLRRCLPLVATVADEIIILDSGSQDDSAAVAAQYGAQWHENTDWQGYGIQRQRAQAFATGDWILALDADEAPDAALLAALADIKKTAPAGTIYGIRRLDNIFGEPIDHPRWRNKAHWRLYPRRYHYNANPVHESVELSGATTAILPGYLHHHTATDPHHWLQKRLAYAETWAADAAARGKKSSAAGAVLRALWALAKQYLAGGRFLRGRSGWIYACLFAQYTFNKYALLYDHNRRPQSYTADYQPHAVNIHTLTGGADAAPNALPPQAGEGAVSALQAGEKAASITAQTATTAPLPRGTGTARVSGKGDGEEGGKANAAGGKPAATRHTLSVVLITKNESRHLSACLASIRRIADEILILDSGSTDGTAAIAAHFGAKWHVRRDWQGFGIQRQRAQALATGDYILMLDADEQPDAALSAAIAQVLTRPPEPGTVYAVRRTNIFCGTPVHGWYHDRIARLYPRAHYQYHPYEVHESLDSRDAAVKTLGGSLLHYTNDNLAHFLVKNLRYSRDWAEEHENRRAPNLWTLPLKSLVAFLREYLVRGACCGGGYGLILAVSTACYYYNKYLMLAYRKKT